LRKDGLAYFNQNEHKAGVTEITFIDRYHFLTGSYDDHIRLFDKRNIKIPQLKKNLEGGV